MEITYKVSPTFARFHQDTNKWKFVMGPVGSGKSSGCIMDLFLNAMKQKPDSRGIRHSRYGVIRATYPQLKSSTIKTFIEWFKDKISIIYDTPIKGRINYDLDDGTSLDMEILFIAIDDEATAEKLRSWEFTGCWVNEAHEIPEYLVSTILPQRCNRFPAKRNGGAVCPQILCDYNAVPTDHWLYKWTEEVHPKGLSFYKQPPAVLKNPDGTYRINPEAENLENLSDDYYLTICDVAPKEVINTDLMNNYGERKAGKPVYKDFDDEEHTAITDIKPPRGVHVIVGLDQGLCLTDKHEILTDSGWKFFKDLDKSVDKVLTRDPNTDIVTWDKINFIIDSEYTGPIHVHKNSNVYFEVTPKHRLPVSTRDLPQVIRWQSAEDTYKALPAKRYLDVTSKNNFKVKAPKALMELLGWYLSEGSIEKFTNRVSIAQKKKENFDAIICMLNGLNLNWHQNKNGFRFTSKKYAKLLRKLGNNYYDKFIPNWMLKLDSRSIKWFLEAFVKGDGYRRTRPNGSTETVLCTASPKLRDGLQALIQLVGDYASWQETPARKSWFEKEQRFIESKVPSYTVRWKTRAKRAQLFKKNWSIEQYSGRVYCVNAGSHVIYTRIGGIAHWTGNSPAAAFTYQAIDGTLVVFDEITTEDCSLQEFAEERLWPLINVKYPWIKDNFTCVIDPAAAQRSMNDAKAGQDILKEAGLPIKLAKSNSMTERREAVTHFLLRKGKFKLNPCCHVLRRGFISDYKYEEKRSVGGVQYKDKPEKNEYSHVHDALQYAAMEYVGKKKRAIFNRRPSKYTVASLIGGY